MSKNPYTTRAGLLGQAEHILNNKFNFEKDKLYLLIDKTGKSPNDVKWPEPPTTEEIIAEAEKLYQFVNKK